MVTTTLDEVVRKTLSKNQLPLHYYIRYLMFAIDGLKELRYTILPAEETVALALDVNKEATLPVDFVGEVGVYQLNGDKLVQLPHNDLISSSQMPVGGFDKPDVEVLSPYNVETALIGFRSFGEVYPRINGYKILPEYNKIRVDVESDLTEIYLKYVTMPQKLNNKTVVHPAIEPALVAYINWQVAYYAGTNDVMMKRAEFFNQRRFAKAMLNKLNIIDILSSFRIYYNQSVKA